MMKGSVLLLIALCLSGCDLGGGKSAARVMPDSAPAPADLKRCEVDADCILVDISCNGCCDRDAVNRKDSLRYLEHRQATCVGELGSICSCCHFLARAACEAGSCQYLVVEEKCARWP